MAYDLSNVRVLIVDPNPFRRTLFCDVLKAIGIEKFEALGDGTTAYSLFRSVPFDIVITEQTMVPLDGLDLTVMIRTNPDSPNTVVPILMVTGAPSVEDVVAARDSGATEYMAERLEGTSVEDAVPKAGLLSHQYPCLASMEREPIDDRLVDDTLMHVSGYVVNEEMAEKLAPYKEQPRYFTPDGKAPPS